MSTTSNYEFLTLGDLRDHLHMIPDTLEYNSMPIIYSHDDEGNEYQAVYNLPSVVRIDVMKSRFIEKLDSDEESVERKNKSVAAIIIN